MFTSLFVQTVLLVFVCLPFFVTTSVAYAPKHTHHVRMVGRGVKVESFHPASTFKTFGGGVELPDIASLTASGAGPDDMASSFIQSQLGVDPTSISYKTGFSSSVGKYAYFKQVHDGIPFANAVANVAFKNDMKAVSMGSSFVKPNNIASSQPSLTVEDILSKTQETLDGQHNGHPASLEYLALPDGSAALTHVIQIQNHDTGTWYEAFVDAHSGDLLSVTDFVAQASYTVVPINATDVLEGTATLTDPEDLSASPLGWHNNGTFNSTATEGNNVVAFFDTTTFQLTEESKPGLVFDYKYNISINPAQGLNLDAARSNVFYITNTLHDVFYKYGFTEAAFNFQFSNFGKGGKEADAVLVSVHDKSGTNNANFATPPDGMSGLCRMYIWTQTTPERDGSVANDILIHENTHGLTTRMTGGGTARCLQTAESGGLGEGWSDAMADWMQQTAEVSDYTTGIYATGKPTGVRSHPYSTNPTVNPLRYSSIADTTQVHNVGEVWANVLHILLSALVEEHGWSEVARTDPSGPEGNIVFLHLFVDALPLQPCNPTFLDARDAIVQADEVRYGGVNKCLIWKVFASRGMGVGAKNYTDNETLPDGC